MKSIRPYLVPALALTASFGMLHAVFAANTVAKTSKGSPAPAPTNAAPVELPVPLATFDLTNKIVKDPFFPLTIRTPVPIAVTSSNQLAVSAACFVLKALSGTSDQRLALINNRTVAVGESAEVTTAQCGKVKIVCLQIKESSVIIRIGAQPDPVEVALPKSAR
jgi:hypothetical protein